MLPIDPKLPAIVAAVRDRGALVLVAEPGAGKTTRVPPALLDAGVAGDGTIVVVQPRRIAARMAAARIADERGGKLGGEIGYRVRFDSKTSRATRVELVTEGILARRLVADPELHGVAVVVFDELHERHLDADLALARARRLRQTTRPDLCVVAMSATLDAGPVARFLDAPTIEVEGRAHPVDVQYDGDDDRPLERRVRAAVVRLLEAGLDGDVLVFLPGASEIRRAMEALDGPAKAFAIDVAPLHGDLPAEQQDRAVRRGPRRKVILATNVAETSLTIESVVAVVDSGLARAARVSPWTGMGRLETVEVSRASATQRAGRAGRTGPGVCVRLYSAASLARRPERDPPEIERADLAQTVLALRAAGDDPRALGWLDAPPEPALDAAHALLSRLGALDGDAITPLGEAMLALPAHPRVARVAIEAHRRGHTRAGALLAALISERDVRRATRTRFDRDAPATSDEVAASDLVARMDQMEGLGARPSHGALRQEGLDGRTVRTVERVARQLERALGDVRLDGPETFDEEEALLLATLAGFPDRVARRQGGRRLAIAGGGVAELDAASAVIDPLLVAVDADERRGTVLVRRASQVTLEHLMELFLDRLEDARDVRFDAARERVVAVSQVRYEGLVVDEAPSEPTDDEAARLLARAALDRGIERFCDAEALDALRRRLAFARRFDEALPEMTDAWLEGLLGRLAEGRRSFAALRDADLLVWIRAELGASTLAALDRLAPEHVSIPGRANVPVTYEHARPPWIASRLQDFYGATEGPAVAGGREPLLLHLLDPRGRAVQLTTDLAGFWDRHYEAVKGELRRRYAKHHWPDDPRIAEPRRSGRRRSR